MQRENLQLIFIPAEKTKTENIDKISVKRIKFYTGISVVLLPLVLILIGLGVTLLLYTKHSNDFKEVELCKTFRKGFFLLGNNETVTYAKIKSRSIFYCIKGEDVLTDLQACSIESALKQFPRKTVYLIQILCSNVAITSKLNKYKYLLKNYYKNMVFLKKSGSEYFVDTPLSGQWDCRHETADLSVMAATAWRFAGTVLTPKVFLNNKTLFSPLNKQIYASTNIFYTPVKCHRFFYQLMSNLSRTKAIQTNTNNLIEDNLHAYNVNYRKSKNLTAQICGNFTCPLVSIEELIHDENGEFLSEQLFNRCPVVIKHLKNSSLLEHKLPKLK